MLKPSIVWKEIQSLQLQVRVQVQARWSLVEQSQKVQLRDMGEEPTDRRVTGLDPWQRC